MQSSGKRRKRVVLTLEEKLAVIQNRADGMSVDKIAEKYNIGASTVSDIHKRKSEIEAAVERNKLNGSGKIRKTLKESTRPILEDELYNWYQDQKLISSTSVKQGDFFEKAKEINSEINDLHGIEEEEEWKPSSGWLLRFKERYGIRKTGTVLPPSECQMALDAAEYLLEFMDKRDFLLKDVITVRMVRDKIANDSQLDVS